jgi:ribosome biogenesis GTPase
LGLKKYGWAPFFAQRFQKQIHENGEAGSVAGRVVWAVREHYRVVTEYGEVDAVPTGKLRAGELPVVGDWVALRPRDRVIDLVLPRRSRIARAAAGERTEKQVVAANVDVVLVVMGLDEDFNTRRMERLLAIAHQGGATPAVVLTKADLCPTVQERVEDARGAAPLVPVLVVSAPRGEGLEALSYLLNPGETAVMVGSSGAGKSTLLNALAGQDLARTREVRWRDGRGKHTTSHRELFRLPGGSLIIDNPGVREVELWVDGDSGLSETFSDVDDLARSCRFRDCSHEGEPGCAVLAAVEAGLLEEARLLNHRKLQRELRSQELRRDEAARRQKEKAFGKHVKAVMSRKRHVRR